jgi:F0F1-type ATP synthase delta subunit
MSEAMAANKAKRLLTLCVDNDGVIQDQRVLESVRALLASSIADRRKIARELGRQAEKVKMQQHAVVTSASLLDRQTREDILASLQKKHSTLKTIEWHEDPQLLGGFTIQVGDRWYDASIANDLHIIREQLSQ